MKIRAYKKMLSLISAASIAVTCFANINFISSAESADEHGLGYTKPESEKTFKIDDVPEDVLDSDYPVKFEVPCVESSSDLSNTSKKYVTSVKNQGGDGVCWAFSSISDYEAAIGKCEGTADNNVDLSENHLRHAVSSDGGNKYSGNNRHFNDGGNYLMGMEYFLREVCGGPIPEANDTYVSGGKARPVAQTLELCNSRVNYYPTKTVSIGGLNPNTSDDETFDAFKKAIKNQIEDNGAVQVSYHAVTNTYGAEYKYNFSENYKCTFYTTNTSQNHGVTVIGWDDTVPAAAFSGNPKGDGAWLVKNSWGTGTLDNGYFWMSYYTPLYSVFSIDTVKKSDKLFSNSYAYDSGRVKAYMGYPGSTFVYNKYSGGRDKLTGIGIFLQMNTAYYNFYVSPTGKTDGFQKVNVNVTPFGGTSESKGYKLSGSGNWCYLDLSSSITLNGDFLVGVEVISPTAADTAMFDFAANSQKGVSFMSSGFANCGSASDTGNSSKAAIIRAYTSNLADPEFAGAAASVQCTFDHLDSDNFERDFPCTIRIAKNDDSVNISPDEFSFSSSNSTYVPVSGIKVTGVSGSSAVNSTPELTLSVKKSFTAGSYYLAYKGNPTNIQIVFSKTPDYITNTGTTGSGSGITSYKGATQVIDFNSVTLFNSASIGGFGGNLSIREIILSDKFNAIAANAFEGCTNFSYLYIPDSVTSIGSNAFKDCPNLVIKCSDKVKAILNNDETNKNIIVASDKDGLICNAGDELKINYISRQVKSGNNAVFMTKTADYKGAADLADMKWAFYTAADKGSSAAKFWNGKTDKNGNKTFNLASVAGAEEVTAGALKASGQLNNVVILKAVSKDYNPSKSKGVVYAECKLYINPQLPSVWKDLKPKADGSVSIKKDKNGNVLSELKEKTAGQTNEYDLTIMEGQSFKLPFALTDGADKTLLYKDISVNHTGAGYLDDGVFTVLNGTVKAILAGTGQIEVISNADRTNKITVNVNVTPINAVKALRANINTLSMPIAVGRDGLEQYVTVSPGVPTKGSMTYKVKVEKKPDDFIINNVSGGLGSGVVALTNGVGSTSNMYGVLTLSIKVKQGVKKVESGEKITIWIDGNEKAKTTVSLKNATAPEPVKNFKETVKLNKATGYRELYVPLGSIFRLGISVNPATADSKFEFKCIKSPDTGYKDNVIGIFGNKGEFFDEQMASSIGTGYYQAETVGKDAGGNTVKSDIYKITVYDPASSIIFDDSGRTPAAGENKKMVVKGGFLMEAENAEQDSIKNLQGGKWYTFNTPGCGSASEPVVWTSSKPANFVVSENGGKLSVKAHVAGTYTITGISQYTKQKYSFKAVFDTTPADSSNANEKIDVIESDGISISDDKSKLTMKAGSKVQLIPLAEGACGKKVVYELEGSNAAATAAVKKCMSLSSAGVLTIKKHYEGNDAVVNVKILSDTKAATAANTISTSTISVETYPVTAVPDVTISKKKTVYSEIGKTVDIKVNGIDTPKFYIRKYDTADKYTEISVPQKKNNKGAAIAGTYTYTVAADDIYYAGGTIPEYKIEIIAAPGNVTVDNAYYTDNANCKVMIYTPNTNKALTKAPVIADPKTVYTEVGEEALALDLALIKNDRSTKNANAKISGIPIDISGGKFRLPINQGKGESSDANMLFNDIDWTISNMNIITGVSKVTAGAKSGLFAEYEFTLNTNGYTGKVTLTGITRNGGKTVKLTVYVVDPSAGNA